MKILRVLTDGWPLVGIGWARNGSITFDNRDRWSLASHLGFRTEGNRKQISGSLILWKNRYTFETIESQGYRAWLTEFKRRRYIVPRAEDAADLRESPSMVIARHFDGNVTAFLSTLELMNRKAFDSPKREPMRAIRTGFDATSTVLMAMKGCRPWRINWARWMHHQRVRLSGGGFAVLSLELVPAGGPPHVAGGTSPASKYRRAPAGRVMLHVPSTKLDGFILRAKEAFAEAGYRGGPSVYYSPKTYRPVAPIGEFWKVNLPEGDLDQECRNLDRLADRLSRT